MRSETGGTLHQKGRILPVCEGDGGGAECYIAAVAAVLRSELGGTRAAAKTLMRWTGAGERTVKAWLGGVSGPSGEHLIALMRDRMRCSRWCCGSPVGPSVTVRTTSPPPDDTSSQRWPRSTGPRGMQKGSSSGSACLVLPNGSSRIWCGRNNGEIRGGASATELDGVVQGAAAAGHPQGMFDAIVGGPGCSWARVFDNPPHPLAYPLDGDAIFVHQVGASFLTLAKLWTYPLPQGNWRSCAPTAARQQRRSARTCPQAGVPVGRSSGR